jgi:CDP-paratose 2-epimerase
MNETSVPNNVLITGGCGFLGSNIASHFLTAGSNVVVIDALFRTGGEDNLQWLREQAPDGKFHFIKGDLAEPDVVRSAFTTHGPFDYVCHLGGQVAMTTSLSDPRRDMLTNVVGTFNILEATREFSPDALVAYSSTNKVYGDLLDIEHHEAPSRFFIPAHPTGLDESLPLDFASPYGCSKGAADQYVRDWFRNYGLKTVVFRHSSIYGGRQFSTFDQGWIGWFCRQAILQKSARSSGLDPELFTIAGTGKQVRDVLHADDLIRLYQAAYLNRDNIAGEIFNIGGGITNSLSLLELFDLLAEITDQPPLSFTRLPPRQSDQRFFVADISKAEKLLQWKPLTSSKQGITRMLDWVASQIDTPQP